MSDLVPCPFCNGNYVDYNSVIIGVNSKIIYAKCPDCKTNFRVEQDRFNTRPREDMLKHALEDMLEMWEHAGKEFNWGASALTAGTIQLMNDAPIRARRILRKL
jgi:hypothetical protein